MAKRRTHTIPAGPTASAIPLGTPTNTRRRARQRMSTARTGSTSTVDQILAKWQEAGLVDPSEFAEARKYVGLTLLTVGNP